MIDKSKGLTLIEIILVLIILGILAAISVPMFFLWTQKSKAAEALASLSTYSKEMQVCLLTATHASTFCVKTFPPSESFSYSGTAADVGGTVTWTVTAFAIGPGFNSTDQVWIRQVGTANVQCAASGVFQGGCS